MLDVSEFLPPAVSGDVLGPEDSFTFRTSTITYYLPRPPAVSHNFLIATEPDDCTKPW